MGFWQLGNTSVRSALRIRDGLVAISQSDIQGNMRGREGDEAFRQILGDLGIVSLGTDTTYSVGRKWRSAMGKLGFLYPKVQRPLDFSQEDLGPLDVITPAGWALIRATTVPAIQECYLRAMTAPTFLTERGKKYSPLCWTMSLLLELEQRGLEPAVNFHELGLFVQTTDPDEEKSAVIDRLLHYRNAREQAERKREFDREEYSNRAEEMGCMPHTFKDYADMNIRYLKASGMVQAFGKGITITQGKHGLAVALSQMVVSEDSLLSIYRRFCDGYPLPTDNAATAYEVLEDLLRQTNQLGIEYDITGRVMETPAQINHVRYELEELLTQRREEIYAGEQAGQWEEIAAYMQLLSAGQHINRELDISFPRDEAAAYLEWSLWRAFLAIDSLSNHPYDVRRFNVDQDFMPVSTAPGNGPDLIAEFDNYVIVIEVTLSSGSRQEAMEGEPVRRHVADLVQQYDKPVYGLFVANRINTNTAETFRRGVWYTLDDELLNLEIVPLTLIQFTELFCRIFQSGNISPRHILNLIQECSRYREEQDAPQWKSIISEAANAYLA